MPDLSPISQALRLIFESDLSGLTPVGPSLAQVQQQAQALVPTLQQAATSLGLVDQNGKPLAATLQATTQAEQQATQASQQLAAVSGNLVAVQGNLNVSSAQAAQGHQRHGQAASEAGRSLRELSTVTNELAGEALPGLGTSLSSVGNLLSAAQNGMRAVEDSEKSWTETTAILGAGLTAAGVGAAGAFFGVFDSGLTQLKNLSTETGLSIQSIDGMRVALQSVGAPADTVNRVFFQLSGQLEQYQQALDAGTQPTGRMAKGLDDIGVSAVGADGKVRSLGELMPAIADGFQQSAAKAAASGEQFNATGAAVEIFGARLGPQLLPLLQQGKDGMAGWTDQVTRLGIGSEDQVAHLESLHQATATAGLQFQALALRIGSDVAPAFTTAIRLAGDAANAYGSLPPPLRDAVVTFPLVAGGALLASSAISAVAGVVGTVTESFSALGVVLGLVTVAEEGEAVAAGTAAVATEALETVSTAGLLPAITAVVAGITAAVVGLIAWAKGNDDTGRSLDEIDAKLKRNTDDLNKQTAAEEQQGAAPQQELQKYQGLLDSANASLNDFKDQQTAVDVELRAAQAAANNTAVGIDNLNSKYNLNIQNTGQLSDLIKQLKQEHTELSGKVQGAADDASKYSIQVTQLQKAQTDNTNATIAGQSALDKTISQYGIVGTTVLGQAAAHKTLTDIVKQEAEGTDQATAVRATYISATARASESDADWAKQQKLLTESMKSGTPEQQAAIKLYIDMENTIRALGPATVTAALDLQQVAGQQNAAGIAAQKHADGLTTLESAIKKSNESTANAAIFQQQYATALAHSGDSADAYKRYQDQLNQLIDTSSGSTKIYYQDLLKLVDALHALGPSEAQAALGLSQLAAQQHAAGLAAQSHADAIATLDSAVKKAGESSQQGAVFQQQYTEALQHSSDSVDTYKSYQDQLNQLIDTSTGSAKSYYEQQLKLSDAAHDLGSAQFTAVTQQTQLNDAFGIGQSKTHDLQAAFPALIQSLKDGTTSANDFRDALLGMESKPTQQELNLKARLADIKDQLASVNSELANGSPAEQHIAALEKIVLQDETTGASLDKLNKDKQALDLAMANASPAAQQGRALADLQFQLDNTQKKTQGQLDAETAHRESLGASTAATQAYATGAALSLGQVQQAYDASSKGQVASLQGVASAAGPAGKAAGEANTQQLQASMTSGLATLNTQLATLPGKLAEALTDPAKFKDAGSKNVGDRTSGFAGGIYAGDPVAEAAGKSLAEAGATGATQEAAFAAAGQKDGAAWATALLGTIRAALQSVASTVNQVRGGVGAGNNAAGIAPGGGFILPTTQGTVTQPFGPTTQAGEPLVNGQLFHEGLDIGVQEGTPLVAGAGGRIELAGKNPNDPGLGVEVIIDFANGTKEILGHLMQANVSAGDVVTQGQQVGLSGSTGFSTGPHVHVQVDDASGNPIDPTSLLGQVLASTSGSATPTGTATATVNFSGGGLPPEWYAAIQAHESTLPLPSPGSPQPMFGFIPGALGSVGTGSYTSGGTAEASASIGAATGYTNQALFPSIAAGMAALDDFWQKYPDAVAAVQRGDFPGFLQALAAHGYAGPGEAPGFISQTAALLGGGNVAAFAGAGDTTGSGALAGFGELPPPEPAPADTALQATKDETQGQRDLNEVQAAGLNLKKADLELTKQRGDVTHVVTQAEVDGLHQVTEGYRATAEADKPLVDSRYADWQAAVAAYDGTTAASAKASQAQIDQKKALYDAALGLYNNDRQNFTGALAEESAASKLLDEQQKAAAAAQQQYSKDKVGFIASEKQATDALNKSWQTVLDTYQTGQQALGSDSGLTASATTRVNASMDAAYNSLQAWKAAQDVVLQDEQALTGVMTAEDRTRLEDRLKTDQGIADSARSAYEQNKGTYDAEAQAYESYMQQMVSVHQAAVATLTEQTKTLVTMDAGNYSDFLNNQLGSVKLAVGDALTGDERRLASARALYAALSADSSATSEQLLRDQTDLFNATDEGQKAILAGKIAADQERIKSDNDAASAVAQDYQQIQTAAADAAKSEIDNAKSAAQAQIDGWKEAEKSATDAISAQKKALDEATTAANAAIDASSQRQIDAIQGQLDAEVKADNEKKQKDLQAAVNAATTPQARQQAEQQLTDFLRQQHDKQLQDQISQIKTRADLEKKANDENKKRQQDTLDAEALATKTHYDGLISDQDKYLKRLEAAAQAHYTHSQQDALAAAQTLLGQLGVAVTIAGGVSPITGPGTATIPGSTSGAGGGAATPPSSGLAAGHWQGNTWVPDQGAANPFAQATATNTQQIATHTDTAATATIRIADSSAKTETHTSNAAGYLGQITGVITGQGIKIDARSLGPITVQTGTNAPLATTAPSGPLVRPEGQDQTAPAPGTQDLSAEGRSFTQAMLHGLGAFNMETMHDPSSQQRLAALADAEGAAFGLAPGWWSHGVPTFGGGFGYRTQAQVQASIQDVAPVGTASDWHMVLASIQYLQAHPDLWLDNKTEFGVGPESAGGDKWATMLKAFNDYALEMKTKGGITVPMPAELMQHNVEEMTAEYGQNVLKPFWFFGEPTAAGQAGGAASDKPVPTVDAANTTATTANTTAVIANTTAITAARSPVPPGTAVPGIAAPSAIPAPAPSPPLPQQAGHWEGNTWVPDTGGPGGNAAADRATQQLAATTQTTTLPHIAASSGQTADALTMQLVPQIDHLLAWTKLVANNAGLAAAAQQYGPDAGHIRADVLRDLLDVDSQVRDLLTSIRDDVGSIETTLHAAPAGSTQPPTGFALGGLLTEPVYGLGLQTGRAYTFAERGSEWIGGPPGGGQGVTNHYTLQPGAVQIAAKDLRDLHDVTDFFSKIEQVARAKAGR